MQFRFIGNNSRIGTKELKTFGQRITLNEVEIQAALGGEVKAALITEEQFNQLFTDDEAKKYSSPGDRLGAPDSFTAALTKAFALIGEPNRQTTEDTPQ